jgi:hypothetical protein
MWPLHIPSDEELSLFLGAPVLSWRPEDLPHFRPNSDDYFHDEVQARLDVAAEKLKGLNPYAQFDRDELHMVSTRRNPALTTFRHKGWVASFVLLRPSAHTSPARTLSHLTGIPLHEIKSSVPKEDDDYIGTFHEIGHMVEEMQLRGHQSDAPAARYDSELHAESHAYHSYIAAGGQGEHVATAIHGRALAGFFSETPEYFLAPALAQRFIDMAPRTDKYDDVYMGYVELRFRLADRLSGANKFAGISSPEMHFAVQNWNEDRGEGWDPRPGLRQAIRDADKSLVLYDDKRALFAALQDLLTTPDVNRRARRYGAQILDAARAIAPNLAPEPLQDAALTEENAADRDRRLFVPRGARWDL